MLFIRFQYTSSNWYGFAPHYFKGYIVQRGIIFTIISLLFLKKWDRYFLFKKGMPVFLKGREANEHGIIIITDAKSNMLLEPLQLRKYDVLPSKTSSKILPVFESHPTEIFSNLSYSHMNIFQGLLWDILLSWLLLICKLSPVLAVAIGRVTLGWLFNNCGYRFEQP